MNEKEIVKASKQYNSIINKEFAIEVLYSLDINTLKKFETFEDLVFDQNPSYKKLTDYSVCDYYDNKIENGFERYNGEELIFIDDFSISLGLEEDFLKLFDKDISKGRKRVLAFGTQFKSKEELFIFIMKNINKFENRPLTNIFNHILYFEN